MCLKAKCAAIPWKFPLEICSQNQLVVAMQLYQLSSAGSVTLLPWPDIKFQVKICRANNDHQVHSFSLHFVIIRR